MKRFIWWPIFVLNLNQFCFAHEVPVDSLNRIALKFIELIQNNSYTGASRLFHFPANYTDKELSDDINGVRQALKTLSDEFGTILKVSISDSTGLFYNIAIGGGDLPYWQKHPTFYRLSYATQFEKEGSGYLIFSFCDIENKWEIRDVQYALPATRPDSKKRIAEITSKLIRSMMAKEKK